MSIIAGSLHIYNFDKLVLRYKISVRFSSEIGATRIRYVYVSNSPYYNINMNEGKNKFGRPADESYRNEKAKMLAKMKRREFLINTAAIAPSGLLVGSVIGPSIWEYVQNSYNTENLQNDIETIKNEIEARYGLLVKTDYDDSFLEFYQDKEYEIDVRSKAILSDYVKFKALEMVKNQLVLYPPGMVDQMMDEVRLVNHVSLERDGTEAFPNTLGVAFPEQKMFIVAMENFLQALHALAGRPFPDHVFHHEFAHVITKDLPENEWESLHPGVGYLTRFYSPVLAEKFFADNPTGFARGYALYNHREDVATIVELLFGYNGEAERRVPYDEILQRKVAYMKKWYLEKSSGFMDDTYWSDVREGRIDTEYWENKQGQSQDARQ